MLAEMFNICTPLLAHFLDLPWVNNWPIAPIEPHFTSLWPESNRRQFQPNLPPAFVRHQHTTNGVLSGLTNDQTYGISTCCSVSNAIMSGM